MKLLVTNDDGIHAKGIYALVRELEKYHEVIVVAPDDQRSACSHSITLTKPIIVREVKLEGLKSKAFSVSGTPADCVRIAVDQILKDNVDMVVSGINRGFNLGTDVLYSGTVSAAVESAVFKIPAVAVSTDVTDNLEDYQTAAEAAADIILKASKNGIKNDVVLNLNVPLLPKEQLSGIKICRIGGRNYNDTFVQIKSENGDMIYEVRGEISDLEDQDVDTCFIKKGYITLTPLHYDMTNFNLINNVGRWF